MAEVEVPDDIRLLRVTLVRGEPLLGTLEQTVRDARVGYAAVALRGHLASARLVLGQRRYTRARHDPNHTFDGGREILGSGESRTMAEDTLEVALRCEVAREREVVVGDVIDATVDDGVVAVLAAAVDDPSA